MGATRRSGARAPLTRYVGLLGLALFAGCANFCGDFSGSAYQTGVIAAHRYESEAAAWPHVRSALGALGATVPEAPPAPGQVVEVPMPAHGGSPAATLRVRLERATLGGFELVIERVRPADFVRGPSVERDAYYEQLVYERAEPAAYAALRARREQVRASSQRGCSLGLRGCGLALDGCEAVLRATGGGANNEAAPSATPQ